MPPILFVVKDGEDDDDDVMRVCMDGKQRLSSIQAFFDGQVRIYCSVVFSENSWPGLMLFFLRSLVRLATSIKVVVLTLKLFGIKDRDSVTKKRWFYTAPESKKNQKLLLPQEMKERFANKLFTCGTRSSLPLFGGPMINDFKVEYRCIDPSIGKPIAS